jgi:hypothetical protein
LLAAFSIHAETRVALVIGKAVYTEAPLANPVNDAYLIVASLKQVGFRVTCDRRSDMMRWFEQLAFVPIEAGGYCDE